TSSTYLLVQADIGNTISVQVSAANCNGSVTSPATASVTKATQTAPPAPTLASATSNSITLNTVTGCEYNINGGAYQTSSTFTGLALSTSYSFTQRLAETATHFASPESPKANFSTTETGGEAPVIISTSLPDGIVGELYSQTLQATGTQPIRWKLIDGSLPKGLEFSDEGVISGTPTDETTEKFVVLATNEVGECKQELSITIKLAAEPPVITTTSLLAGKVGEPYHQILTATGTAPMKWEVIEEKLPTGLTISTEGVISGTPTESGTFKFTVEVSNIAGSDKAELSIFIDDVGISENDLSTIIVYPNPTIGELVVSSEYRVLGIEIFDIYGRAVSTHYSILTTHYSIDLSHLPSGVYLVIINAETGIQIRKVIKL
ncbi:MAG: T9SS type A sorting domain-containing protein, partial [Bacteroidales bacterium]|nr:T9SS type A sorting domain-containing protein [Bacteroidales bacterium]